MSFQSSLLPFPPPMTPTVSSLLPTHLPSLPLPRAASLATSGLSLPLWGSKMPGSPCKSVLPGDLRRKGSWGDDLPVFWEVAFFFTATFKWPRSHYRYWNEVRNGNLVACCLWGLVEENHKAVQILSPQEKAGKQHSKTAAQARTPPYVFTPHTHMWWCCCFPRRWKYRVRHTRDSLSLEWGCPMDGEVNWDCLAALGIDPLSNQN